MGKKGESFSKEIWSLRKERENIKENQMWILKLRNIITKQREKWPTNQINQNPTEWMGSTAEWSWEDRVSELETRSIEFINLTTEREGIWQKKKKKWKDNKDNNKRVNISITEVSEEERESVELFEKVFEQIMDKTFQIWWKIQIYSCKNLNKLQIGQTHRNSCQDKS